MCGIELGWKEDGRMWVFGCLGFEGGWIGVISVVMRMIFKKLRFRGVERVEYLEGCGRGYGVWFFLDCKSRLYVCMLKGE